MGLRAWALLGAAALSACGSGIGGGRTLEETLDGAAAHMNRNSAKIVGNLPGSKMTARVENGDTIVLRLTNVPSGTQTYDPNAVRKMFRPEFCNKTLYNKVFAKGGKVRLELVSNFGKELPAIQFARC